MNLAFAALVITILIVPGAVFLSMYRSGPVGIPTAGTRFQDNLPLFIIATIPIHGLLGAVYWTLRGAFGIAGVRLPMVRYDYLVEMVTASAPSDAVLSSFGSYMWWMLTYVLTSVALSFGLALLARNFVRLSFLDIVFPILRPNSYWHYFFTGEQKAIQRAQRERRMKEKFRRAILTLYRNSFTQFVFVSFVVDHGGRPYLYWGALVDYRVEGDRLVQVTIEEAQRRPVERDATDGNEPDRDMPMKSSRFYPIRGDYITFDAEEIVSINVEFYRRLP